MQAGGRVARLWKKRMPSTNRIHVSSTRHRAGDLGLATLSEPTDAETLEKL